MHSVCKRLSAAVVLATVVLMPGQAAAGRMIVGGFAEIRVKPDMAILNISVDTRATQAAEAQAANIAAMEKLVAAIAAAGVKPADMQASQYSLQGAAKRDQDGNSAGGGYRSSNSLTIAVRDLKILGNVLAAAAKNGGANIDQLNYVLAKPKTFIDRARKLAFDEARVEAELSAKASGSKLIRILRISDGHATSPPPQVVPGFSNVPPDAAPELRPDALGGTVAIGYEVEVEFEFE